MIYLAIAAIFGLIWFFAVLPAGIESAIGVGVAAFLAALFVIGICVSGNVKGK